jgi:Arc/MetJ family transcription regulator
VDVLDFGKWLKETTQRQRLDALDQRRIAMQQYSGGGQVVQLTGRGATDSAVDAMFKDLVGRNATTDEKARFFAAFRKDEAAARMTAARANQRDAEAGAMASLDPATRGLLEDEAKFEMYKVDPVIRVGGQLMHASDAPRSEWANIARRHGVNYDAIADYYRRNPKTTPGSVMGGGNQGITTVETTDVGSAAIEAAKASPEYMPTQVGRAGQYYMKMLGGEYGMPGVQSG